jgi:hypothetical protein
MVRHTPGPWEAVGTVVQTVRTADGGGFLVADCPNIEVGTLMPDRLANARLIAAAPELFAVCKELLELYEVWGEYDDVPTGIIDRARMAVDIALNQEEQADAS